MKFAAILALLASRPSFAREVYDAVIVGGGYSGLSAAKALAEAGKTFIVLEARNRTGGRVYTVPLENGGWADLGGTFIGPTQDKVIELAQELGVELFETLDTGNNILWHRGERTVFEAGGPLGPIPPLDDESLTDIFETQTALDEIAAQIDVYNPWNSPNARKWDAISLGEWLHARGLTESANFMIEAILHSIFSVEPAEQSMLFTATYIAAAGNETHPGNLGRLIATTEGAQMWRVENGAQTITTRLAERLGSCNIALNSPVTSISKTRKGYNVKVGSGKVFQGTHVIVAMSPPVAALINFQPPLPANHRALQKKMHMGSVGKGIGIYETPFWVEEGFTGQVVSDAGLGRVLYDQSARDGSYGGIMAFLEADELRKVINEPDDKIADIVEADFVNYFGPEAKNATERVVFVWDRERYSLGGPTAIAGNGIYTRYGPALKKAVGNIHFAGTEASDYWIGYLDGAVRAGYRAAAEVIGR